MDNKNKFQEMLGDILEIARVQGNQLGMNEIKSLFGDLDLNEAQYEHIFAYLAANHIKIKGYVETESEYTKAVLNDSKSSEEMNDSQGEVDKNPENQKEHSAYTRGEDSAYLKMYLKDLEAVKESTPKEEGFLIDKIVKGDNIAKNRYIEGNLHYVVEIAQHYRNQGVSMEDLIQEGNIGLISSLEAVPELKGNEQGKKMVTGFIKKYMEAAIAEQKESSSFEDSMVKQMNYIRDAANELTEELGREANIHELAGYIKMSEEEIADILGMTVDGVNLDNKRGYPEDLHPTESQEHNHNHNHTEHRH
ncbi:MAG: sigma-70 domain-containing protein [Anaerocolumna sp.]